MEDQGFLKQQPGFATVAIHAGQEPEKWKCAAVVPAIVTASTFQLLEPEDRTGYLYGRIGNPTRNTLEECLAALEDGKYGFTFASGLGATSTIVSLLSKGDHIISIDDIYGGTNNFLRQVVTKVGIETSLIDFTVPGNLERAIQHNTKMIWIETPTNPNLIVVDIAETVKLAKSRGDIIVVVDNTFLTCYLQKPLNFGADIVMYSITKYINGHSDVIMGAAIVNDDCIASRLRSLQGGSGCVPSPFDCYLVNRSLKTLALRMERHKESSLAIAQWLEKHPNVTEVKHPGLPSHKQHHIAKKQMTGHSGVFSFKHSGDLKESKKWLLSLKLFTLAVSLGGYESLAEMPSKMTHACLTEQQRIELGITHAFIRLSIELEDVADLIEDLDQAFKATF